MKTVTNEFWSLVERYYDPATDQFLSVDPAVAQTGQPYAFTEDDPLNQSDPLGLKGWYCINGQTHYYHGNVYGKKGNGRCGSAKYPIVDHAGSALTISGGTVTVKVTPHVIVEGPNPYDNLSVNNGSVSFDSGHFRLDSSEGLTILGPNGCGAPISKVTFGCTITTRKLTVGRDSVQGALEVTDTPNTGEGVDPNAVAGASSAVGIILWWVLKPACLPAGPLVLVC